MAITWTKKVKSVLAPSAGGFLAGGFLGGGFLGGDRIWNKITKASATFIKKTKSSITWTKKVKST